MVAVSLTPNGFRLTLDSGDSIKHDNAAVQDTEAPFHFNGKVHVAGGVNNIDYMVSPLGRGGGGRDGDPSLPLLSHPIHHGSARVNVTDLVGASRVEKEALSDGGLAGVNMGDDADVPK
jgi:hypothetical protein